MVSFQAKFSAGLEQRGIAIARDLDDSPYDAVLVTAGTSDLAGLRRARRGGVRIVQRLDGINWVHRRRRGSLRTFLKAEYGNRVVALIRRRFADRLVYQSAFVQGWWNDWFGEVQHQQAVIHNGVDLALYTPEGEHERPADRLRLLVVEGSLGGQMTPGLEMAGALADRLAACLAQPLELWVAGSVAQAAQAQTRARTRAPVHFTGVLPRERIPALDRSAHLLFSAEIISACPNAVIEALACGLPVTGFRIGALPELVVGDAGRLAPYGGDPWKLEAADLDGLTAAAAEIAAEPERFRRAARAHTEAHLGLDGMIDRYLDLLLG